MGLMTSALFRLFLDQLDIRQTCPFKDCAKYRIIIENRLAHSSCSTQQSAMPFLCVIARARKGIHL